MFLNILIVGLLAAAGTDEATTPWPPPEGMVEIIQESGRVVVPIPVSTNPVSTVPTIVTPPLKPVYARLVSIDAVRRHVPKLEERFWSARCHDEPWEEWCATDCFAYHENGRWWFTADSNHHEYTEMCQLAYPETR